MTGHVLNIKLLNSHLIKISGDIKPLFDFIVFAPWPRGLYLAEKLSEKGKKTAYVEILPRPKSPFGLFLDENSKEEREFLKTLGFLFRQEGGFCLLSSEGVWPLQNVGEMKDRHPVLTNKLSEKSFKDFKNHWLTYLSFNLAGKVFEYNNSELSDKSLNLFSDYFLFEPSFKKTKYFQTDHHKISFYKAQFEEISFDNKELNCVIQNQTLKAEAYFWLAENHFPILENKKNCKPYWQWTAFFLKTDFGEYKEIIPSHFVSIQHLFLPWSHDNLLSVFNKRDYLEVWVRQAYEKDKESLLQGVKEHLKTLFPKCVFSSMEKTSPKGPIVYGKEKLELRVSDFKNKVYIENLNDFFQGDLASEIRAERKLFKSL